MRSIFLGATGLALAILAATGMADEAYCLAILFSIGEIASLFCADVYYAACAAETDTQRLRSQQADAAICMCVGCLILYGVNALAGILPEFAVNCAAGFVIARTLLEMLRVEGNRGTAACLAGAFVLALLFARFVPVDFYRAVMFVVALGCIAAIPKSMIFQIQRPKMALLKQLPRAASRAAFLIPATAACVALHALCGVQTVLSYAAGLTVFALLNIEAEPRGAAQERFPVLWLLGGIATLACVALGWNGVVSGMYCAWAVLCAVLLAPGQFSGRSLLCALLTALQGACGWLLSVSPALAAPAACVPLVLMIVLLRGPIYAAWLPVRAWLIRRRARR